MYATHKLKHVNELLYTYKMLQIYECAAEKIVSVHRQERGGCVIGEVARCYFCSALVTIHEDYLFFFSSLSSK